MFDVFPLCNVDLQETLKSNRKEDGSKKPRVDAAVTGEGEAMDEDAIALQAALAMSMEEERMSAATTVLTEAGLPADFKGMYELMGVVTHTGRSADSGHYIGWVRQREGSDVWWKFDDQVVTEVTTAEILELKGGGDWHMAYLNFYRYKH